MVDKYIVKHKQWQSELDFLRGILLKTELQEEIKWGAPTYTLGGKNVVGLGAFKSYVGLWFFQGVFLTDKSNVLFNAQEGKTKAMRQWRFTSIEDMDANLIKSYIKEAIANQKVGKELKPQRGSGVILPELLRTLLDENPSLKTKFESLTPYKQKEYCEYIEEARREVTKESRIKKIVPLITKGIGLHDKYRK